MKERFNQILKKLSRRRETPHPFPLRRPPRLENKVERRGNRQVKKPKQ
ncbi:MAG: hypothetical protein HYY60_01595 [Parcubacteria group bacterium]|nr:hypothetical protein [Parcubacteria group bacterium]MBI3074766.1 hypothetical protein [Parcubacteria group bacterium]